MYNVRLQYDREFQPPTSTNRYTGNVVNKMEGKELDEFSLNIFIDRIDILVGLKTFIKTINKTIGVNFMYILYVPYVLTPHITIRKQCKNVQTRTEL